MGGDTSQQPNITGAQSFNPFTPTQGPKQAAGLYDPSPPPEQEQNDIEARLLLQQLLGQFQPNQNQFQF